jgi:hypothetical protein
MCVAQVVAHRVAVDDARLLLRDAHHAMARAAHLEALEAEVVREVRARREQRDRVVHIERAHEVPDRLAAVALGAAAAAEGVAEPLAIAAAG